MKRLVKLNGKLTDLLGQAAGTLLNGNSRSYAASPYSAYTGMWGVGLPQNANLQATSSLRVFPATFPKGSVFTWDVTRDPNWAGVEGYLSTSYGNYDNSPGRITPWQVYAITALSVSVGWTYRGDASSGLLCECWLSPNAAATGPVAKTAEVGFWPKVSASAASYLAGLSTVGSGSFTSNSVTWNVRADTGGTQPYYIAYRPGNADYQGALPFADFFAFLISAGKITGNEWFNGVAFGVEPYSGAGTLTISDFTATYAGAARVPWTISNLTATPLQSGTSVSLAWTPAPGATSHQYRINGGTWTTTGASNAQTVTGLTGSTTYTFEVRGVNLTGGGASSNVATATTLVAAVAPPYSDQFPGPSIDSTKWPTVTGSPTPTIMSGRLRTSPASGEVDSGAVYDLTKYRVYIQIPTLPTDAAGTMKTRFWVADSGYSNIIQFDVEGNPKILWSQGNGITPATVASYNSTSHQWLGLQVVGGNLLFQGSPDGVNWTTYRTVTAPAWITSSLVRVMLGCFETGATQAAGQFAEYDNFNA